MRAIVFSGGLLGCLVSTAVYVAAQRELAAGHDAASVGFGVSHLLFLVSLPWSALVWLAMLPISRILDAGGSTVLAPFFYAMPVAAGLGWAALVANVVDAWRLWRRGPPVA